MMSAPSPKVSQVGGAKMSISGTTILIVDDEEMLRNTMIEIFKMQGALTTGAENGKIAFELLKEKTFDVVVSDVRMPGGDGVELLTNIQNNLHYQPKIFLCTGYADLSAEKAKSLGATALFAKPFQMKNIFKAIEQSLEK